MIKGFVGDNSYDTLTELEIWIEEHYGFMGDISIVGRFELEEKIKELKKEITE